jgi:hypothetical protein
MHLASVINELAFVVKAVFGEPSDFLGVCCVESDGVGGRNLVGSWFPGNCGQEQEVALAAPPHYNMRQPSGNSRWFSQVQY